MKDFDFLFVSEVADRVNIPRPFRSLFYLIGAIFVFCIIAAFSEPGAPHATEWLITAGGWLLFMLILRAIDRVVTTHLVLILPPELQAPPAPDEEDDEREG